MWQGGWRWFGHSCSSIGTQAFVWLVRRWSWNTQLHSAFNRKSKALEVYYTLMNANSILLHTICINSPRSDDTQNRILCTITLSPRMICSSFSRLIPKLWHRPPWHPLLLAWSVGKCCRPSHRYLPASEGYYPFFTLVSHAMIYDPIKMEDTVAIVVKRVEYWGLDKQERAALIKVIGRRSAGSQFPHTDLIFLLFSFNDTFKSLVYKLQAVV